MCRQESYVRPLPLEPMCHYVWKLRTLQRSLSQQSTCSQLPFDPLLRSLLLHMQPRRCLLPLLWNEPVFRGWVDVAAERLTVRGTTVGSRPFATDAEATSTADMDVPFATGDAPGTDATTTVTAIVVSTSATTAVVVDKQISRVLSLVCLIVIEDKRNNRTSADG
ncbi:hypothetical protein NP493_423g00000 [Ridgeia piscesae]|uniref:Uncharacterized protein n=1 Tax=Ridgeia piscesae TaxID=27915 RepID=A0AAD9L0Q0_RIDPI|nr:hypothetical protein NP493_423g00000 [Ridgeia piscesae]